METVRFLDGPLAGEALEVTNTNPVFYVERYNGFDADVVATDRITYVRKPNPFRDGNDSVYALEGSKAGDRCHTKVAVSDEFLDSRHLDYVKRQAMHHLRETCSAAGMVPVQIRHSRETGNRPGVVFLVYEAIAMPEGSHETTQE